MVDCRFVGCSGGVFAFNLEPVIEDTRFSRAVGPCSLSDV